MPKVLGVVPARGGSKGVQNKNIRDVAGKPLLAWTIEAACKSALLDHFLTSTDSPEIAEVARRYGSAVSIRPSQLALDSTPMVPVVEHVLAEAERLWGEFEYVCLLQPTSPQRTADDIDQALTLLMSRVRERAHWLPEYCDSVISVYLVEDNHPARMYRLSAQGFLVPYNEQDARAYSDGLRQQLPAVYHRNGAIYACRAALVREEHDIFGKSILPYIMPKSRSGNIDDPVDLIIVDALLRQQYGLVSKAGLEARILGEAEAKHAHIDH